MQRTITLKDWMRKVRREGDTPLETSKMQGPSPGGVATEFGLTRQAVHAAIRRGDLDAWRVVDDATGKLRAIIITSESVTRYRTLRSMQASKRLAPVHVV